MRINHNIAALNTYRQLSANTTSTSKSLEKLSSGLRINRAGDDAAGLAISEKMRGQIRGLDQATRNANDGISLIQTAEGALNETHSILQRMRELAVQAANDTNTKEDRAEIQKEINQLAQEISRISTDTEFNTKKLLDGTMAYKVEIEDNASGNITDISIEGGASISEDTYSVSIEYKAGAEAKEAEGVLSGDLADKITFNSENVDEGIETGEYTFTYVESTSSWTLEGTAVNNFADYGLSADDMESSDDGKTFTLKYTAASDAKAEVFNVTVTDSEDNSVDADLFDVSLKADAADGTYEGSFTVKDNSMQFQIGANSGQATSLSINNMSAKVLGVDNVDLTTQADANTAIDTIGAAIEKVSSQRAALGGMQNRLEHTINNLGTTSENLSASESRIRDVDMAQEMMEFTKNNILSQASQAMLAQANMQPQSVLQLLQ